MLAGPQTRSWVGPPCRVSTEVSQRVSRSGTEHLVAVMMDQAGSPMPEVHLGSPEVVGPMVEVELPAVVADLLVVAAVLEAQDP